MDIKKVIAKYPRIHLTPLPTPLEFAPQLTKMLGGPKIYVKRDDLTAIAFGGDQKTRIPNGRCSKAKCGYSYYIRRCPV